jgi:cytochrome c peroxidase
VTVRTVLATGPRGSFALLVSAIVLAVLAQLVGCSDDAPSRVTGNDGGSGGIPDASADATAIDAADADADGPPPYDWNLPKGFAVPKVPEDNPMTAEKVALGRRIFYDKRLSKNETQSCASCHLQSLAFTDGLAQPVGSTGMLHPRSSMSLANMAYAATLTWANPLLLTLERQAQIPIFGQDPVELGTTSASDLEARFKAVPLYVELFAKAFPGDAEPITLDHLLKALGSFQRTLISGRSPYDRWVQEDDQSAISAAAKRGYALFHSEKLECFHCHVGFLLTDHTTWTGKFFGDRPYHNTGLYNIDGAGAYPAPNTGVEGVTHVPSDMGRFKAPTLRNIAVTAPYMHDGSIATLDEVLDHYVAGGRTIASGPNAGNGSQNPLKNSLIVPLVDVTPADRADLLEFLRSLTDQDFLTNPAFSDPWVNP